MTIEEHIPLAEFTTFRIGGPARFFCRARSVADLEEAVRFSEQEKLQLFLLGGGSNLLISDGGFDGLVVKMEIRGIEFRENADGTTQADAGAGEDWDAFVAETVRRGLSGVENLSLIPGTVGAAPVQNIGAYGAEAKDSILSVEVFNIKTKKADVLSAADCRFGYRDSIFKHTEGKDFIITCVRFSLRKDGPLNTKYKDVAAYFAERKIVEPPFGDDRLSKGSVLTLVQVREAVVAIRTAKLPDLAKFGTAGSFFKNPIVTGEKFAELKGKYTELPGFPEPEGKIKIPAAWILDKICGFRGIREGDAGTYQNQALVLVNYGKARAAEIIALAEKMEKAVQEKTGIRLEREAVMI